MAFVLSGLILADCSGGGSCDIGPASLPKPLAERYPIDPVGYTDARLLNKNGWDLGWQIPGINRIRYLDWK